MNGMFRILVGVSLSLALLATGCAAPKEPIRIGVNSWPPCEVWTVAKAKGFFGNTPVELVRYSAWTDNVASLYVGKVDITHSTYFNSVYYDGKGEPGVLLAPIDFNEGSDGLVIKNTLKGPSDLKGKKIGVEIGTDEHYLLYKALERYHVRIEDVTLVSLPSSESYKNFKAGEIDGLFTYEPYLSKAAKEGNGSVVFTTKDLPGHMVDALVVRESIANSRKDDIRNVMHGWYQALDYIRKNPEETYRIMSVNEGMTPSDFKSFYESFTFYSEPEANHLVKSSALKEFLNEMSAFSLKYKLNEAPIDTTRLLKSPNM